jgi:hypothetical protein
MNVGRPSSHADRWARPLRCFSLHAARANGAMVARWEGKETYPGNG